jgi:hypothetical protein
LDLNANTVRLTLYNEVFDVNAARADAGGREFEVVVSNGDYSVAVVLGPGKSETVVLPRGEYAIAVNQGALGGEYEYIALIGPDGPADGKTLNLQGTAADVNATVLIKEVGAPTVEGGYLEVVKYVIDSGRILSGNAENVFQINVDGTRIVTVGTLAATYGLAADSYDADDSDTNNIASESDALGLPDAQAPAGAPDIEDAPDSEPVAGLQDILAYEPMDEEGAEATTPNEIGTDTDGDVGEPSIPGEPQTPPDQETEQETDQETEQETDQETEQEPGEQPGQEPEEGGQPDGLATLVEIEERYMLDQNIAQGGSYRFSTGRGIFQVREVLPQNIGYSLTGMHLFNENTHGLPSAASLYMDVAVGADVGSVVLVLNSVEPIRGVDQPDDPAPPPATAYPVGNAPSTGAGGQAPVEETELPEEELPGGAALFDTAHVQYLFGYPDGTVRPDISITRAETAAIIFRLLSGRAKNRPSPSPFSDVADGQWYTQAVAYLAQVGIINGYPDGTFKPDQLISRAEFAKLISEFDELQEVGYNVFSDIADNWAVGYINGASEKGWLRGYPDGTFKPLDNLTRAEIVTSMNRVLNRQIELEDIPQWAPTYTDLASGHWAYAAIIEASVTHDFEYKDNGYELWQQP